MIEDYITDCMADFYKAEFVGDYKLDIKSIEVLGTDHYKVVYQIVPVNHDLFVIIKDRNITLWTDYGSKVLPYEPVFTVKLKTGTFDDWRVAQSGVFADEDTFVL